MTVAIEASFTSVDGLRPYLARPVGGSARGMLLLPMITGIGEQVRDWADELARHGVTALTWDPWHGVSSDDTAPEELSRRMAQLDDEVALGEQHTLLAHLRDGLGCPTAGVIGWCLGGRYALILGAREEGLANVIAYHPTVTDPPAPNHTVDAFAHTARIKAPVLMMYPGADDRVNAASFNRLQSVLQSRPAGPSLIHFYPGAEHGFSSRQRHTNPVNAEAFALSWPHALSLIDITTASSAA